MSTKRRFTHSASLALALAVVLTGPLGAAATEPIDAALTETERAALVERLEQGAAATEALIARAEGDLFTRQPAEGRWSVSEVLEHIAATEELLLGLVRGALDAEPDPEWRELLEATPLDAFGERVQDRSRPAQAPEVIQPKGAQTREEGLDRFRAARAATLELVRSTEAPVKQHTTPVPGGKLSAQHLLVTIASHTLRHNQQIAEALEQLGAGQEAGAEGR